MDPTHSIAADDDDDPQPPERTDANGDVGDGAEAAGDGVEITHEPHADRGRYRLFVDGDEVGELEYFVGNGTRDYVHTGVRPSHEGRGLAARLVRRALDDARSEGHRVIGSCPYVGKYLDRHPEYADLRA